MPEFTGFSPETYEFFMALRFNNNRPFFYDNHDWYERAVRTPCTALCRELGLVMKEIDPLLEITPVRSVSHINRDLRYSNDKTPYREEMWIHYRRPEEDKAVTPGFWFDISTEGAQWGMGYWRNNKPMMNALRRRLRDDPSEFDGILAPIMKRFAFWGDAYKRMDIPAHLNERCRLWYPLKCFYLKNTAADESLVFSPTLLTAVAEDMWAMAPLYTYLRSLPPEEDPSDTVSLPQKRPIIETDCEVVS